MTGKNIFLQIGASRDGTDPYLDAARRRGLEAWLIETSEYAHCRRLLGRREFDRTITLANPSDSQAIVRELSNHAVKVVMALPGFEQYAEGAYIVARWLGVTPCAMPSGHQFSIFQPMDKSAQRDLIKSFAPWIHQPRYVTLNAAQQAANMMADLRLPVVVKPVNSGGGWGVFLARTPAEFQQALVALTGLRNYDGHQFRELIVEEYLSGVEYSVQGICCDGSPCILTFCEKLIAHEEATGEAPLFCFREAGHLAVKGIHTPNDVRVFVTDCLRAVGYRNGPFHIDMIRTSEGLQFIEMGFRLSGGGLTKVVQRVSGLDWGEQSFAWLLERKPVEAASQMAGICLAQLVPGSEEQIERARELQTLGYEVESRISSPVQVAASLSAEEALALRADLSRHIGRVGFIWITAPEINTLRLLARYVLEGRTASPVSDVDEVVISAYESIKAQVL